MNEQTVYLAGAITGLSFGDADDWRQYVAARLNPGILPLSPLRLKDYLRDRGPLQSKYDESLPLSTSRGIMTRDHYDVQNCSLVLANLLNVERVSIGTTMEMAWAYAYRRPLILVAEKGSLHDHGMVDEAVGYRVQTIDEAIFVANAILTAYVGKV